MPACTYRGKTIGVVLERGLDADHYNGGVAYLSRMGVTHFECSVCGREPTDELEVSAAGIPTKVDYLNEDYEPTPWPE